MGNAPGPLKNFEVITEDGNTHNLFSGNIHFKFLDGTGLAPVKRIIQKSPLQQGGIDRGYRFDVRNMLLSLVIDAESDTSRDLLASIFAPTDYPLTLKLTRDDNTVRYIDCYVDGLVDFPMSNRIGTLQIVEIPLVAPNPSFYNITQQSQTMALTDTTNVLTLTLGDITYEDYYILDLSGPIASTALILQQPGADYLRLSSAIPSGETFRFDFRPNYKTVVRTSDDANRLSYLTPAYITAFQSMKILPPKISKTINSSYSTTNTLSIICTGTSGLSSATVYWYKRYISL